MQYKMRMYTSTGNGRWFEASGKDSTKTFNFSNIILIRIRLTAKTSKINKADLKKINEFLQTYVK